MSHIAHEHDDLIVELHHGVPAPAEDACPPAVIVRHDNTETSIMLGRSPIDGRLVLHIDGEVGLLDGLARIFMNDGLIFGEETPE